MILLLGAFWAGLGTPQMAYGAELVRGDVNKDGNVDITDPINILGYLFQGESAPACLDAADIDDSGSIDITDPIVLLTFLFGGGDAPAAPYPQPGHDLTPDDFRCGDAPAIACTNATVTECSRSSWGGNGCRYELTELVCPSSSEPAQCVGELVEGTSCAVESSYQARFRKGEDLIIHIGEDPYTLPAFAQ